MADEEPVPPGPTPKGRRRAEDLHPRSRGWTIGTWGILLGGVVLLIVTHLQPTWPEHRSVEGRFAVDLPGPPQPSESKVETPSGPVAVHAVEYTASYEDEFYKVEYSDGLAVPGEDPERLFDRILEDAIAAYGVRFAKAEKLMTWRKDMVVLTSRPYPLDGHPGRETRGDALDHRATLTIRTFLVDRRVYVVSTSVHEHNAGKNDARFLASFRLLP
jgi:hypothetical protein